MKLNIQKIILLGGFVVLAGAIFVAVKIGAQDDPFDKLTYPIAELGNCADKESCGTYCDKPANMGTCLNFARDNNLMPEEDIETAERMLALGETQGPGGCKGKRACESYCDEIANIKECVAFAEKNNLIPQDELEEAKKVISAMDKGLTPPKCKGKKECDVYCSRPENMEECITFAKAAGLMPPEEAQDAEKMLAALKKGIKPPNCAGKKECDSYCSKPVHIQECMEFAIAAGFMPQEEAENAKKSLEAIRKGFNPPDCRGKEECDVYCSEPAHGEECLNFAEAAGFISPEDAKRAREGGGAGQMPSGPGGCKTKEECDGFCSKPENREICIEFGAKNGNISPEDLEKMKREMEGRTGPGDMRTGPGGCQSEEECKAFCQKPENKEECMKFGPGGGEHQIPQAPKGGIPGLPQGFEGKCNSPESCTQYCAQNFQDPICQGAGGGGIPGAGVAPPAERQTPLPPQEFTPPPGNMSPPPETTSPPPPLETQTLLQWTKKMLANVISALLPF